MNDAVLTDTANALGGDEHEPIHPTLRPRDAATLILIDRAQEKPRVLFGRRHHGHTFMPGKFVYPGGRVEPQDRMVQSAGALDPRIVARLMLRAQRPSPAKARGLGIAAIREVAEETGLLIGRKTTAAPPLPDGPWSVFAKAHVQPDLGVLHFIARAITPPGPPRRFDTRFFATDASAVAHRIDGVVGQNSELVELVWLTVEEARRHDLARITRAVLDEIEKRIACGFGHELPVPFYRILHGKPTRVYL
jgi:8-oxo-dGTP pyrophosphatase MutT (NUDIX family)